MRSLDDKVPELPRIIVVAFLAQPPLVIRLPNLLDNAPPRLERIRSARSRPSVLGRPRLLAKHIGLLEFRGSHLGRHLLLVPHLLKRLSLLHISLLGIALTYGPKAVPQTAGRRTIGRRRTPRRFPAAIKPRKTQRRRLLRRTALLQQRPIQRPVNSASLSTKSRNDSRRNPGRRLPRSTDRRRKRPTKQTMPLRTLAHVRTTFTPSAPRRDVGVVLGFVSLYTGRGSCCRGRRRLAVNRCHGSLLVLA